MSNLGPAPAIRYVGKTALVAAAIALFGACGASVSLSPTAASAPTSAPSAGTPTPAPAATETAASYDSDDNMVLLFSAREHVAENPFDALARARENNDKSQVPVIIEILHFFPVRDLWAEAGKTLFYLTGQDLGGNLSEFQPPERYLEWKVELLSLIDPRYERFLSRAGKTSQIELPELVWGGVAPDRIPDLQNPPHVALDDQSYLYP